MAESKSNWFARNIKVHSEKLSKFVGNHFKRFTRNFGMSDATPPATGMFVTIDTS